MSMNIHLSFVSKMNEKLRHDVLLVQTGTDDSISIIDAKNKKERYFDILKKYIENIHGSDKKEVALAKTWYKHHMREVDKLFKEFKPLIESNDVIIDWYIT